MDVDRHTVAVNGIEIAMPLKEFELLELLLRNAGRVLTRGQLIDRVWGSDYFGDTKTLDVHIKRIRSRIEEIPSEPTMLVTVRGLGYRFEARDRTPGARAMAATSGRRSGVGVSTRRWDRRRRAAWTSASAVGSGVGARPVYSASSRVEHGHLQLLAGSASPYWK